MEDAAASSPATPTSILVCREDGNDAFPDADDGADFSFGRDDRLLVVDHDDEYFALLLSKERASADAGAPTEEMADWIKAARSGCVRWIIKTASTFRFGGKTAYVAVTYYDRFLAQQKIERGNEWGVHLLAVTCLSLAAKVEYRRPTRRLSEFRLDAYAFGSSDIMRMELLVLAKLQWHMITVTPFAFISCFAARFRRDERRAIIVRAAECVFDAIKVMSSVEYKPSTIALASILVARNKATSASSLDELKTILGSSWPQLDTGRVHSCYSTMIQEDELSLHSPEMASSGVSVAADVGVSSLPAAEDALAGNPNEPREMATEAVSQDSKATRPRKLNPRYYGPAWLNK